MTKDLDWHLVEKKDLDNEDMVVGSPQDQEAVVTPRLYYTSDGGQRKIRSTRKET